MKKEKYCKIQFTCLGDKKGYLIAIEENEDIPFDIKRVFYIFDVDDEEMRGRHANRKSEFVMVALHGNCKVRVDDGKQKAVFTLSNPNEGLYLSKMVWKEMFEFSKDAVLLVLSNEKYDSEEYIRDYEEFVEEVRCSE